MDLFEQIQQLIKELDISVRALRKTGTEFAEAEKQFFGLFCTLRISAK